MFRNTGTHVLVDGQFGSTGKGALAAYIAQQSLNIGLRWAAVASNAGPNSGHTFYHGDTKHVLKQLPSFGVYNCLEGNPIPVYLTGGAVIDLDILAAEAERYPELLIFVHPNAAVITADDKNAEHSGSVAAVAGTRSGTGAAIARKVLRDPEAVFGFNRDLPRNVRPGVISPMLAFESRVFVEVSQGFSLGINQRFYPKSTSRECTVAQGLADAGIPPNLHAYTYLSLRTYPIRVGNVDGHSSGDWYSDQQETTWEAIGVEPELTTVTQRVRRIATFSRIQYRAALASNWPNVIFCNFMNYLKTPEERWRFSEALMRSTPRPDVGFLWGYGPKVEDIRTDVP
jgi:adenylosuccinate synthase